MNLKEYKKIKEFSYLKYCNYLHKKYGVPLGDFFTQNWSPNKKIKRANEGLYIHHIMEDHAIMLGNKKWALQSPYEWQQADKLVYCDLLEHLFLHILICENPHKDKKANQLVGFGGVINFLVPELNDVFSGWITKEPWRLNTHNIIINDLDVYLELVKRFKNKFPKYEQYLYTSLTEKFPIDYWSKKKDKYLFDKIKNL